MTAEAHIWLRVLSIEIAICGVILGHWVKGEGHQASERLDTKCATIDERTVIRSSTVMVIVLRTDITDRELVQLKCQR